MSAQASVCRSAQAWACMRKQLALCCRSRAPTIGLSPSADVDQYRRSPGAVPRRRCQAARCHYARGPMIVCLCVRVGMCRGVCVLVHACACVPVGPTACMTWRMQPQISRAYMDVGAGVGVSVGEGVGLDVGAGVGAAVGAGDGDGLGDCVQTGVLHGACSIVKGHRVPVPSEIVVMVRWRLERPPPPANLDWGKARVRTSDRKAYNLRCSFPTQSRLMPRGS
jgi:hypothetical protein